MNQLKLILYLFTYLLTIHSFIHCWLFYPQLNITQKPEEAPDKCWPTACCFYFV